MRTSPALCQAGDLLLMEAIGWHPPLPLAVPCSLAVTHEVHGDGCIHP